MVGDSAAATEVMVDQVVPESKPRRRWADVADESEIDDNWQEIEVKRT